MHFPIPTCIAITLYVVDPVAVAISFVFPISILPARFINPIPSAKLRVCTRSDPDVNPNHTSFYS